MEKDKKDQTSEENDDQITPLVKNISGFLDLPEDYDHREKYIKHLIEKYS